MHSAANEPAPSFARIPNGASSTAPSRVRAFTPALLTTTSILPNLITTAETASPHFSASMRSSSAANLGPLREGPQDLRARDEKGASPSWCGPTTG